MELASRISGKDLYHHTVSLILDFRSTRGKLLKVYFMTFYPFQSYSFKNAPTNLFI